MDVHSVKRKAIPFLSKWWFSILLIFFSWFIINQYWQAINSNIFLAVSYDHPYGFSIIYFILDNLTLLIHEAGHTIFGVFGWRFLTVLGGTLLQLLVPFSLVVVSWRNQKLQTLQASLYWLGFCWLDSAAYAADAYHQNLPLIGNLPKSTHDFLNILSDMNILNHYKTVAWSLYGVGITILLTGIILPFFNHQKAKEISLDLKL